MNFSKLKNLTTYKRRHAHKNSLYDRLFIYGILILPILNFIIFYAYVRIEAVALIFQKYVGNGNYDFAGFDNFREVYNMFFVDKTLLPYLQKSLLIFFCGLAITPLPIFISYLIWKKIPFADLFKIILFLPNIIPGMVFTLAGKYNFELVIPKLFNNPTLNLLSESKVLTTLFLYTRLLALGSGLVIYLGTISSTDASVLEYGKLDGLNAMGEFIHIILPHIYPTFIALFVPSLGGWFSADVGLYTYFGETGVTDKFETMGYYQTYTLMRYGEQKYPFLNALSMFSSLISIPIVFVVKHFMEKFGPSED